MSPRDQPRYSKGTGRAARAAQRHRFTQGRLALPTLLLTASLAGCNGVAVDTPSVAIEAEPAAPTATAKAPDPAAAARLEYVRQSIAQGLDVNKADDEGRTPLMMAAFDGLADVAGLLLENDAEINQRDGNGRTALMYASSGPFRETVDLLLEQGAEVNTADSVESWTALMFAAAEGHQDVVESLLRHGADLNATDQDGEAAIEHARQRGQSEIVALLESWPPEK
jgi:ankyrin repeat protein